MSVKVRNLQTAFHGAPKREAGVNPAARRKSSRLWRNLYTRRGDEEVGEQSEAGEARDLARSNRRAPRTSGADETRGREERELAHRRVPHEQPVRSEHRSPAAHRIVLWFRSPFPRDRQSESSSHTSCHGRAISLAPPEPIAPHRLLVMEAFPSRASARARGCGISTKTGRLRAPSPQGPRGMTIRERGIAPSLEPLPRPSRHGSPRCPRHVVRSRRRGTPPRERPGSARPRT